MKKTRAVAVAAALSLGILAGCAGNAQDNAMVGTGAAVEEELVEGMQAEDEHDHDHDGEAEEHAEEEGHAEAEDHEHEGEPEYDEHVWLSLRNAQTLVGAIADALSVIDPAHADTYAANAAVYQAELADLDARYKAVVENAAHDALVFADRFPFRYLVDDYGLSYFAAFAGCSSETEASFEIVAFLAQKLDELGLGAVLTIEGSDQAIARTVVDNTTAKNQKILVLDSLQSVAQADVDAGKTYLTTMEQNLAVLEEALS